MSSGPNPIVLVVRDGVDPAIITKLDGISTSARTAQGGINNLQASLNQINGGSLQGLSKTIGGISTSTQTLAKATQAMGAASAQASGQVNQLSASYATLALRMGVALSTLQAFTAAANSANGGILSFRQNVAGVGSAVNGAGLSAFQASSAFKVLEGNSMGASLAAGALIRQSQLMSSVLAAAFPVIGALALVEILGVIVSAVTTVIDRFRDLTTAIDLIPSKVGEIESAVKKLTDQTRTAAIEAQKYNIQRQAPSNAVDPATRALNVMQQANAIGSLDIDEALRKQQLEQINLKTITDQLTIAERQLTVAKQIQTIKDNSQEPNQTLADNVFGSPGPVAPVQQLGANPIGLGYGIKSAYDLLAGSNTDVEKAIDKVTELRETARLASAEVDKASQDVITQGAKTALDRVNATNTSIKDMGAAQLREFKLQMDALKIKDAQGSYTLSATTGQFTTNPPVTREQGLQDQLSLVKTQEQTASETNLIKLKTQEATITQEITRIDQAHEADITNLITKYNDEAATVGLYSDSLKEAQLYNKALQQIQKDGVVAKAGELDQLKESITYYIESADYQRALGKEYSTANEPLRAYIASQQALDDLFGNFDLTAQQYVDQNRLATKTYQDAVDPLNEWNHSLQNQIDLFGQYGQKLEVATQIEQVENILRQQGKELTDAQTASLQQYLTAISDESTINSDLNKIYTDNAQKLHNLVLEQQALNTAKQQAKQLGVGTDQLNQLSAQNAVAQSNQNIQSGNGTGKDYLTSILGTYGAQFKGFATEIDNLFTGVFNNIADEAAHGIGAAIAGTESWSEAAKELGSTFVSSVVGGLIKIALQWVIMKALGDLLNTSTAATAASGGATVAAAWVPAAVAVDIATFGAASAAADIALATSFGLGAALSVGTAAISSLGGGKAQGGWISGRQTSPFIDTVLTPTVPGEFIVNAIDAQRNAADLQRINSGGQASGSGKPLNVNVIHDGSTNVDVQQLDENTVTVIAKREAKSAVYKHGPDAIASDLQNANSKTSKAVRNNVQAPRRRS